MKIFYIKFRMKNEVYTAVIKIYVKENLINFVPDLNHTLRSSKRCKNFEIFKNLSVFLFGLNLFDL